MIRPQPIGLHPFPASNLLLPNLSDSDLQKGDTTSETCLGQLLDETAISDIQTVPDSWRFYLKACTGDHPDAVQQLSQAQRTPVNEYNRFVLEPSLESYDKLKNDFQASEPELLELLEVAAYSHGIIDQLPSTFSLNGELLAWALATAAAASLENSEPQTAVQQLQKASNAAAETSPLLAAELCGQVADVMQQYSIGHGTAIIQHYRDAIRLAEKTQRQSLLADLHMKLGMLMQNLAGNSRGGLLEAVNAYQTALHHGITEQDRPLEFATLQNNLGLAYLSMPAIESSNHIRTGIAVQSFRHALRIYDRQSHPDMWATINMNLANAFQYAPTSHPEENLIQAVETYELVLEVRTRERDPVAYATVLANQANALAHLGMFKPALEKIAEAYKLFQWYDINDQAVAARELVEQINTRIEEQKNMGHDDNSVAEPNSQPEPNKDPRPQVQSSQ